MKKGDFRTRVRFGVPLCVKIRFLLFRRRIIYPVPWTKAFGGSKPCNGEGAVQLVQRGRNAGTFLIYLGITGRKEKSDQYD